MKKTFKMKNLGCAHCAAEMESKIQKLDGVKTAGISFMMQKITIEADDERFNEIVTEAREICKKIEPGCTIL